MIKANITHDSGGQHVLTKMGRVEHFPPLPQGGRGRRIAWIVPDWDRSFKHFKVARFEAGKE